MTDIQIIKNLVSSWAISFPEVRRVWLFGSRAKNTYQAESDIDIAIEIEVTNPDHETPYAHWICERENMAATLRTKIPLQIDLQFYDEIVAPLVFSYVGEHGILLFDKANLEPNKV